MVRKAALAAVVILATFAASAGAQSSKAEQQALALVNRPVEEVEALIKTEGDFLNPRIEISSHGATQIVNKGLLGSTTNENSFLRAFIDKKTGQVSAQIYHVARYGGRGWHFFHRATYETQGGIKEVETIKAGSDVDCSRYGCTHYEDLIIPVEFSELEAAAAKFDPSNAAVGVRYRLFGQSGETIDDAVPGNEIAAFVNVVRRAAVK